MKKLLLLFVSVSIFSCGSLDELGKDIYTVTPKPLEVHGGRVKVDMKAKFGPKIVPKDVFIEVTPMLMSVNKYENKKYPTVSVQGEEFPGNSDIIPYEAGKEISFTGEVSYSPNFEKSILYAYVVAKKGSETVNFPPVKLSKGVILTSFMVNQKDLRTISVKDKYQKLTSLKKVGMINFLKNSSSIRNQELLEDDFKTISDLIIQASKDSKVTIKGIYLDGYASPEGEVTLNENLADNRAKQVYNKLKELFEKTKLSKDKLKEISISEKGHGADWVSFSEKLEKSDIKDKDVIKRTIDEKTTVLEKEKALVILEKAYPEIEEILSDIRRSEIVVEYEVLAKTDEEIKTFLDTDISKLNEEEIVYGVNQLLNNDDDKIKAYEKMINIYPSDYRSYNNLGVLYFSNGKIDMSKEMFTKSYEIEKNEITNSNLAVIYLHDKEFVKALQLLDNVSLPESKYNKGIMQIMLGEYQDAINNMSSENTFNLALAKCLNKDYEGSLATLNMISDNEGIIDYLKAIVNMRLKKTEEAKKFLESADQKTKGFMDRAKQDLEFDGLFEPINIDLPTEEVKKRAIEVYTTEVETLKDKLKVYEEENIEYFRY